MSPIRCLPVAILTWALPVSALGADLFQLSDATTVIRHREEVLQWTPESVTVLGPAELDLTYRQQLEDLEAVVPGLLIDALSGTPRGAAISMRGVGSAETGKGFFPAVAVNVDGVYIGTHTSQNQLLFDLDRVEVARGPQGVFQGPPATGGTINLFRSRPTGQFSANTRMIFGNFTRKRFDAAINFPLPGNLAGKLTFNLQGGGRKLVRNAFNYRDENEDHLNNGSLALRWHNERVDVQYTYDDEADKSDVPALLNLSTSNDLLCATSVAEANCSLNGEGVRPETDSLIDSWHGMVTTQNFSNLRKFDAKQHALSAHFTLAGHQITSITALRRSDETSNQDLDATFVDFYSTSNNQDYKQFSQELDVYREVSPSLSYVFGAYLLGMDYRLARTDLFAVEAIAAAGRIPAVPPGEVRTILNRTRTTLQSLFFHTDFTLNEQWRADIGARVDMVKTEFFHTATTPNNASNGFAAQPVVFERSSNHAELTGSAGLTYKVDENAMIYSRISHATRPGGFDDNANSEEGAEPYSRERVDGIEFGLKSEWLNDKLRLNWVVYQNDFDNKLERVTKVVSSGRAESVVDNVSSISVTGHEVEIETVPLDNLSIRAALNHTNADYLSYVVSDLTGTTDGTNLETLSPSRAPADMIRISGLYTFPYWQGQVKIYGAYRFTTKYWSHPRVPAGLIETFTLLDASIDFDWHEWTFRVFSQNINDNRYLTNARQIVDSEVVSLPPGTTSTRSLLTSSEFNPGRFSGLEILYKWSLRK